MSAYATRHPLVGRYSSALLLLLLTGCRISLPTQVDTADLTGIDDITDVIDGDTDANEGTDPDQGTDPAVNVPPTVTINAPGDNALLSGTEPIVFVATIEDDNGLDDIATIEWSTDGGASRCRCCRALML
jgi:hypothetical protein